MSPQFTTGLRGYDIFQVNEINDRVQIALASTDQKVRKPARSWQKATPLELPSASSITLRRHGFLPYMLGILVSVGLAFAAIVTWPLSSAEVTAYTATVGFIGIVSYIGGPSVYVRITGTHVLVANTFFHHEIPRGEVEAIVCCQLQGVKLKLHTGDSISVDAFEFGLSSANRTYRGYWRRGKALERAIVRVPARETGGDRVARRVRYSNPLFMVLGAALLLLAMSSAAQV